MIEQKKFVLEEYFHKYRNQTIGIDAEFTTPYGKKPLIYADWVASGRLYDPIETLLRNTIGPRVGNTHSEASYTGRLKLCTSMAGTVL